MDAVAGIMRDVERRVDAMLSEDPASAQRHEEAYAILASIVAEGPARVPLPRRPRNSQASARPREAWLASEMLRGDGSGDGRMVCHHKLTG